MEGRRCYEAEEMGDGGEMGWEHVMVFWVPGDWGGTEGRRLELLDWDGERGSRFWLAGRVNQPGG